MSRGLGGAWVAVLLVGCGGTAATWGDLGGAPAAQAGVYEAVIRYVHAYYRPPSWNPSPAAWCLATDRRSNSVLRERERAPDSPWSPAPRLLASLSDLVPAVVGIEECVSDPDRTERLRSTGEPAVVVTLSAPEWSTPDRARVEVWTRQDNRASNRFVCRVMQSLEAWRVQECL